MTGGICGTPEAFGGGFVGRSNVLPKILTINCSACGSSTTSTSAPPTTAGVSGIVKVCIAFEL